MRGPGERRVPADHGPAVVGSQVDVLLRPHAFNKRGLAPDEGRHVHRARRGHHAGETGRVQCHMAGLRGSQERLRRHTAGVHACPAQGVTLNHYYPLAQPLGPDRGRKRRAPGTNDRQIEPLVAHPVVLPRNLKDPMEPS
ncbi:hypothetical protein D9M72_511020 [compost metagenome]